MEISKEKFDAIKHRVKLAYDGIEDVYCPYFEGKVRFSSDGFQHLLYKGSTKKKERDRSAQYMRLKLFELAPKVLKITRTLQEHHVEKQFVSVKMNKRREKLLKEVNYWGFIAILDGRKVKVIVKQVGGGLKRFWSIIPNWSTRKSREFGNSYLNYSGDLEND